MRRLLYILLIALMAMPIGEAAARRAKMRSKPVTTKSVATPHLSEGVADSTALQFSGYDKPAISDHETFFATNVSATDTVRKVEVEIDYRTTDGRQLHSRKVQIDCVIPPAETRMLTTRSWDKQHSFRYYRSREGRASATPYDVHIRLLRIWLAN